MIAPIPPFGLNFPCYVASGDTSMRQMPKFSGTMVISGVEGRCLAIFETLELCETFLFDTHFAPKSRALPIVSRNELRSWIRAVWRRVDEMPNLAIYEDDIDSPRIVSKFDVEQSIAAQTVCRQ